MYKPSDNTVYENIRRPLQARLVQAINADEKLLAKSSIGELVGLLFVLYGQTNSLGAYGDTIRALHTILGEKIWEQPKIEAAVSEVIQ